MEEKTKNCPICAEKIPINAEICPFCGERIQEISSHYYLYNFSITRKQIICLIIIILFMFMLGTTSWYFYNWYNDPVRIAERNANKYYNLAKIDEQAGKNKEAINNYIKALNEKFDLNEAKVPLVKLCIKEQDTDCVNKYIEEAYELMSDDIQLKFYYAISIIDNTSKSIPLFKSVLEKEPNNYWANKIIGAYYFSREEYKTAQPYLKKCADMPDNKKNITELESVFENIEDENLMLATIHIMNDEYTKAINILDKVIKKNGSYEAKQLKNIAIARREEYMYNKSREEYYKKLYKNSASNNYIRYNVNGWDD